MENDSTYGQVIRLPWRRPLLSQSQHQAAALPSLTDLLTPSCADVSATAFLLARLSHTTNPILWVQDHASRRETGYIYMSGLASFGIRQPILQVRANHPRDVLWAMEEGARCASLSAVIGEIHGAPPALDITATKRLAMRADASGVPVFLLRSGDPGVLSAARERWRITSLPSKPHLHDAHAPGTAQWDVDLFRARGRAPGRWMAWYDPQASRTDDRLHLVSSADAGAVETGYQPVSHTPKG